MNKLPEHPADRQMRETLEDWGKRLHEMVMEQKRVDSLYPEILWMKKPSKAIIAENS